MLYVLHHTHTSRRSLTANLDLKPDLSLIRCWFAWWLSTMKYSALPDFMSLEHIKYCIRIRIDVMGSVSGKGGSFKSREAHYHRKMFLWRKVTVMIDTGHFTQKIKLSKRFLILSPYLSRLSRFKSHFLQNCTMIAANLLFYYI